MDAAEARLTDAEGSYSAPLLAKALRRCEREQPALATWVERRLSKRIDDAARGLGASMAMTFSLLIALVAVGGVLSTETFRTKERQPHFQEKMKASRTALKAFEADPVPGTEGARLYEFSPDGRWIAFFTQSKLWKVAVSTPIRLPMVTDGTSRDPEIDGVFVATTNFGDFEQFRGD